MSAATEARKRRNARERERRRLTRLHAFERQAHERGFVYVGGIDEVGRGPLAGPVVAACVVIDQPLMLPGLDDSKRVRPEVRVELAALRLELAVADADHGLLSRMKVVPKRWALQHARPQCYLCSMRPVAHRAAPRDNGHASPLAATNWYGEPNPRSGEDSKLARTVAR